MEDEEEEGVREVLLLLLELSSGSRLACLRRCGKGEGEGEGEGEDEEVSLAVVCRDRLVRERRKAV